MRAPELSTSPEKIDRIINRINSGDIRIPAFQRAYVWKQSQILDLLDSILRKLSYWKHIIMEHFREIKTYKKYRRL